MKSKYNCKKIFISYKKILTNLNLLILNIIATLFIIILPPNTIEYLKIFSVFILLFLLPGIVLLKVTKVNNLANNLIDKLLLSLPVGLSFWILSVFTLTYLNIRIYLAEIIIIIILFTILLIVNFHNKKLSFKNLIDHNIDTRFIILYSIFNIIFFINIIPTKGLISAPLHDPAQNSVVAYQLIRNDFLYEGIPYYTSHYPPGAAYIVGLVSISSGINTATTNLVITNIFHTLVPFSFGLLLKTLFKNKNIEYFSNIILSFISMYTLMLYSKAGKNSQIIAYFFLFISWTLFHNSIYKNLLIKFIVALVIAASFLIHYNNFPIFIIISFIIFINRLINEKKT